MLVYADVDETIVAISSAPGAGVLGIVRLSGPDAVRVARELFVSPPTGGCGDLGGWRGFRAYRGSIMLGDAGLVPGVVWCFRAPRSYTRQDLIELHTVGSVVVLEMIVEQAVAAGARLAHPGEFTARAFLHGAMSLAQAEGVAATINARTADQLRAARRLMRDDLSRQIQEWRERITDLLALVTADIDFSEEPIDFIHPDELMVRIESLRAQVSRIITGCDARRRIDPTPRVQLLGPPNSGKSTLINRLCGYHRAVASPAAGLTRDLLAATVRVGDRDITFVDAAGVDDNPDPLIARGRARALEHARDADVVCLVVDTRDLPPAERLDALLGATHQPVVIAANKVDVLADEAVEQVRRSLEARTHRDVVMLSAATGRGVPQLARRVVRRLDEWAGGDQADTLLVNARQRQALVEARDALDQCCKTVLQADATLDVAELVAFDLGEALDALGRLTGAVTTDDLLHRIFSSFCIGK